MKASRSSRPRWQRVARSGSVPMSSGRWLGYVWTPPKKWNVASLVGGLEHVVFPIFGLVIPIDSYFFLEGLKPPTRNYNLPQFELVSWVCYNIYNYPESLKNWMELNCIAMSWKYGKLRGGIGNCQWGSKPLGWDEWAWPATDPILMWITSSIHLLLGRL